MFFIMMVSQVPTTRENTGKEQENNILTIAGPKEIKSLLSPEVGCLKGSGFNLVGEETERKKRGQPTSTFIDGESRTHMKSFKEIWV